MPVVALCAAILHGSEAAIWAAAYVLLGALPDRKSAMLYSLEALNGVIVFGLTTAFLIHCYAKGLAAPKFFHLIQCSIISREYWDTRMVSAAPTKKVLKMGESQIHEES
jgi:hypothetical protein